MQILKTVMKDKMDIEMLEYVNSYQYLEEQNKISSLINKLKEGLSNEQITILNKLLDEINISDSEYSYEAFFTGVINGIFIVSAFDCTT